MFVKTFKPALTQQIIKQNRLLQAFADLAQSPEMQDFLNLSK